ncbi:aminotransferase class I/II-fold pyridoxal phosphate-dependent enzyme [Parathermosynechococcus lividus]
MTHPLLDILVQQQHSCPFHTPGHQRGRGMAAPLRALWGTALAQDLSEIPGLDNLAAPTGVLADLQAAIAAAAGSDRAWCLVNGATAGVLAALLATLEPKDVVLVGRNVHHSVISGLILTGAQPVYLGVAVDSLWGIPEPVSLATVVNAVAAYPTAKAVVLVSPTYEGLCSPLAAIAQHVHERGLTLIVDEAHGSHFAFHPRFPSTALAAGADLVIQSWHKTLGTLTQTAVLHLQGTRVAPERVSHAVTLVQTTSPSYWLLSALEAAAWQMVHQGYEIYDRLLQWVAAFESPLPRLERLDIPQDPLRLTLGTWPLGLTGADLEAQLQPDIIAELPSGRSLTFCVGLGTTAQMLRTLAERLRVIHQTHQPVQPLPPIAVPPLPAVSSPALSPRTTYFSQRQVVPLAAAIDHISAETIAPYPPGIPTIIAGEVITAAAVAELQQVQAMGGTIIGARDPQFNQITIVAPADH